MDYIPIFIANGFYRNKTEFVTRHVVYSPYSKFPKVMKYLDIERLKRNRDAILVKMEFEHKMISHTIKVKCDFDSHDLIRVYRGRWNIFDNAPIMHAGEWCLIMREVVNRDHTRLEKVLDIFEKHHKIIVFYNFDYELEALRDGLQEYFLNRESESRIGHSDCDDDYIYHNGQREGLNNGNAVDGECRFTNKDGNDRRMVWEYNGHTHDPVPEGDEWIYLVQYNAGSEAWNCITTDTIVFYSLNYSYKIMEQASGRIRRMNSPFNELYYYVLYSESVIDRSILTALKNKKEFQAGRFYRKTFKEG